MSILGKVVWTGILVAVSGGLISLITCPRYIKPYCYNESLSNLYFNEIAMWLGFGGGAVAVVGTIIRTIHTSGKAKTEQND